MDSAETIWYAHSAKDGKPWQTIRCHTQAVSEGARDRAPLFLKDDAYLAGLFHDLGKYSPLFKKRLEGEASGLDHWTPGAYALLRTRFSTYGGIAVHAHHVGLGPFRRVGSLGDEYRSLEGRTLTLEEGEVKGAVQALQTDGFTFAKAQGPGAFSPRVASMLDVRFVLSCLVDADHSDTAAHFKGVHRPEGRKLDVPKALASLEEAIERKSNGEMAPEVRALRADLRAAARQAADAERGLFALEAPTGAGKTLAMLEFALRHMARHSGEGGLRRIVVVLPFLSVLDQTVKEIKAALGVGNEDVFQHHSLAPWRDADGKTGARGRELAEDWDAPIVVTTSVQFLQTLFADKTVPLRKLHALSRSVILLDEIQTVPRPLALATMRALARLAAPEYGCSVVLSTATQPGWEAHAHRLDAQESPYRPTAMAPRSLGLFGRIERYRVDWSRVERPMGWDEVARELVEARRVLAIVNRKDHARLLTEAVERAGWRGPLLHMSTNLCPAHRERVLADPSIHAGDCVFVATQCVEAGVDLDFPVVYRAVAPLEAIVQAAGRCNRHGNGAGEVRVFKPEDERYPGPAYEAATRETLKALEIADGKLDLQDPAVFDLYYPRIDSLSNDPLTTAKLERAIEEGDFPEVARIYRLIEERDVVHVLVPYPGAPEVPPALTADWFRKAMRYSVSAFRKPVMEATFAQPISEDGRWWRVTDEIGYDPERLGLRLDAELPIL